MKVEGRRELDVKGRELTRDEWMRIIALREEGSLPWQEIGR
jgi:hypothetical protein